MNPVSSVLFLISLTLCLNIQPFHVVAQGNHGTTTDRLITKACEHADDKPFCIDVLKFQAKAQTTTLKRLTKIALRTASENATSTYAFINDTIEDPNAKETNPSLVQNLVDCARNYRRAIELLDDAEKALDSLPDDNVEAFIKAATNKDVQSFIKAALASIDTCTASAIGFTGKAIELYRKSRTVRMLISNALGVSLAIV